MSVELVTLNVVNIAVQPGNFSGTDNGEFIICGLVGAAGILGGNEEKAFRNLLILDTVRGEDSTGIAAINSQNGYSVVKEVGVPHNLFDTKRYESIFRRINRVLIGHNRSATVGNITRKNAHPFDMETLIGAHNGTLHNKHRLADSADYTVDSENLFHHIEKHSLKEAIDLVDGAYALVWWDKFEQTLNFLRNEERPLFLARTKDTKTIFWASEMWMLNAACARNNVIIDNPVSLDINKHLVFSIENDGSASKPKAYEMKSSFVKFVSNHHDSWSKGNVVQYPVAHAVGKATTARNTEKKELESSNIQYANYSSEQVARCSNRKAVVLKIIGSGVDKNKANYVSLLDYTNPGIVIRMYVPHNSMLLAMTGKQLTSDIAGVHHMSGDRPYFLAPMSTHKLVERNDEAPVNKGRYLYNNGKGSLLTKEEWEKQFSNCEWCFDMLFAEDHGNRLLTLGDGKYACFCGKCAADPEATEGFNLKSVY